MGDALSDLDLSLPCVWCVCLLAVVTLQVLHHEFDLERLLEESVCLHFFLHAQLYFDSTRVRLRPDKWGIKKFDAFESFDIFETKSQQLSAFKLAQGPGWPVVSIAVATVVQHKWFRDAFSNINLALQAVNTSICRVGFCYQSTDTTAYCSCLK